MEQHVNSNPLLYTLSITQKECIIMKTGYKEFEILLDVLGAEQLLNELIDALSGDELLENMEYIARMQDVDLEEEL